MPFFGYASGLHGVVDLFSAEHTSTPT